MELIKSKVVFNEAEHKYTLEGRELSGITRILSKHLFPDKYKNIPEATLNAAAERGSHIHKEIQEWIEKGESGFTDELQAFISEFKDKYDQMWSEFLVNNDRFATAVDLVTLKDGKIELHDIKTTYALDLDYLSWQLSICAYLFERMTDCPVHSLNYIWIRGMDIKTGEIPRKTDKEVEDLLQAEIDGEIYKQELILPETEIAEIVRIETYIKTLDEQKKQAEAEMAKFKEKLISAMEEKGVKSIDMENIKITYIAPSCRETVDTKKLKAEYPEIAEKLKKSTKTKASVRITLRGTK